MRDQRIASIFIACMLALSVFPVAARSATIPYTTVDYSVTKKAGTAITYAYSFTVRNATNTTIDAFRVFFDFDLFSILANPQEPNVSWYVASNDPATVTDPGTGTSYNYDGDFYAEYYGVGGIAPNTSVGTFTVEADYLPGTTPPALTFALYDITYGGPTEIAYGVTGQAATIVPAPATAPLLLTALALTARRVRRRRQ